MTSASVYLSWPEDFKLPLSSLISLPPMNCLTMIELTRSTLVFGFEMVLACFCLKKANIVTLWYPSVGTPFAVSEFSHCSQVLSRHQFLEMLLRVADQRYVQTGPAAECCRSTWTVQLFPQGHGPFFGGTWVCRRMNIGVTWIFFGLHLMEMGTLVHSLRFWVPEIPEYDMPSVPSPLSYFEFGFLVGNMQWHDKLFDLLW